jgi:hypothetical protein
MTSISPLSMDSLRQIAVENGYKVRTRRITLPPSFLGVVGKLGRSHEAAMLGLFKKSPHVPLLNDMDSGVRLFMRGKVPILPGRFAW